MAKITFHGAVVYSIGGVREADVPGRTLKEVLEGIMRRYPVLDGKLVDRGSLSTLFLVFVDGRNAHAPGGLDMEIGTSSEIRILNALTGG